MTTARRVAIDLRIIGRRLPGLLDLTDERGGPLCAAVRPPRVQWRVSPPPAVQPDLAAGRPGGQG
jgi:hypothetical protein